ncbi:hypothetical protein VTK73DRAFT_1571 [Phialemonium thermophilum]|uniref:Major facilitator superfamily (MFS) profile domain-containing protein n=1 Tax=Phialemonium thermophilum TaxID=223376 RepID=A0ABR3VTA2_9PEZI
MKTGRKGAALLTVCAPDCLYAGRVIAGLATGLCSTIAPMYISEVAPKAIRGALATSFNLILLVSLSLAFWINYGVSRWKNPTDKQWRISMAVQIIPGGLLLLGMLFQKESPRYLISHDRHDDAVANLTHLRRLPADHPFVATEIAEITQSVALERASVRGSSVFSLIKEIAVVPSNRRRYAMAMILQVFQQMTGTNAINYFAPSIFASVGVTGTSASLLATGVYGIVKIATSLVYVFLIVDNVGRRRPLMVGAVIQACCLLYLAVYVKLATIQAGHVSAGGYVGLVAIYIYAFGWSFGWSVVPWVVPSEIFPNRIRALAMSSVYAFQWLLNFAITRGTPYMMVNMDKWGAYLLFAVFTFAGAAWTFFFFPELKGRSIESMDRLFEQSSWTMLKRAYPTEEEKTLHLASVDEKVAVA